MSSPSPRSFPLSSLSRCRKSSAAFHRSAPHAATCCAAAAYYSCSCSYRPLSPPASRWPVRPPTPAIPAATPPAARTSPPCVGRSPRSPCPCTAVRARVLPHCALLWPAPSTPRLPRSAVLVACNDDQAPRRACTRPPPLRVLASLALPAGASHAAAAAAAAPVGA
nr:predicted GPI-anchored protein 58 [Aegilops tauschii subsp. strangulata]